MLLQFTGSFSLDNSILSLLRRVLLYWRVSYALFPFLCNFHGWDCSWQRSDQWSVKIRIHHQQIPPMGDRNPRLMLLDKSDIVPSQALGAWLRKKIVWSTDSSSSSHIGQRAVGQQFRRKRCLLVARVKLKTF